ncbi:pilin [Vibrio sp. NH-UV-68]|uniref:pilin n=1 Tax=unclassified Vibrio TaxID=2614977 RepID=UPI0036F426C8
MHPQRQRHALGFTLIELMIVVAVISLLSAVAIPHYQSYVKKAALSTALASASAYKVIVEDAIALEGRFPAISQTFAIGTIRAESAPLATDNATNDLVVAITQGSGSGQSITLKRDANGAWRCSASSSVSLAGCS